MATLNNYVGKENKLNYKTDIKMPYATSTFPKLSWYPQKVTDLM